MVKSREREDVVVLPAVPADVEVARLPVAPPVKAEAEEPLGRRPIPSSCISTRSPRYKLLRPDEEVSLAKEIENGRILDELSDEFMEEHLTAPPPSS